MAVRLKAGVELGTPQPAGLAILHALFTLAQTDARDVVITSGSEARGRKPTDTHMRGVAFDVSVAGLEPGEIRARYDDLTALLGPQFLVLFEAPPAITLDPILEAIVYRNSGATAPHLHVALRKDQTYP